MKYAYLFVKCHTLTYFKYLTVNMETAMKLINERPKSQQVAEYLKSAIRQGKIKPGERLESIRTMAQRFGVGRQIILSAFNRLEVENILDKQVGRGTFVRHSSLSAGGKLNIAFCVRISSLAWFFNRNLFLGCAAKAEELGVNLTIAPGDANVNPAAWCAEHGIDGLLVTGQINDTVVRRLNSSALPYLVLGSYDLKVPANILTPPPFSAECLTKAFEKPVMRPGVILGDKRFYVNQKILDELKKITAAHDIDLDEQYLFCSPAEDGYEGMKKLMSLPVPPDLLIISGRAFSGAARYIFETGIKRPIIISPLSDDQHPLYPELIDYPLESGVSATALGAAGIELIIDFIKNRKLDSPINQIRKSQND